MPLMGYVAADQRTRLLDLLRRCRRSRPGSDLTEEFRLESRRREVRLFCRPRATGFIFTSLVDLTEVKRAEAERRQATAARAALAGRLISIQEDERHRIARDMHDNIGQQMTALRLKLDTMAMDPAAGESLRAHIVRAQEAAEQLDRALDFIAAELRPASLEHGFVPVLEEFVRDWSATFGIRAEFHTNGLEGVQLSPAVAMHMYRVMQEALNNIFKHARAGHAQVIVERRDEGLILIVEDDGAGFSPEGRSESSGRGLGLVSMRERAALIGGSIEIESTPGKGSTVFFQVPNPGGGSGDGQA
jgi:signal transduction histidine kinase